MKYVTSILITRDIIQMYWISKLNVQKPLSFQQALLYLELQIDEIIIFWARTILDKRLIREPSKQHQISEFIGSRTFVFLRRNDLYKKSSL